jgi:hypothetical protein
MLASEVLKKKKTKVRKAAEEKLKKAKWALSRAEGRAREELRVKGVAARTTERERKKKLKTLKEQGKRHILSINTIIPPELLIPIRDL